MFVRDTEVIDLARSKEADSLIVTFKETDRLFVRLVGRVLLRDGILDGPGSEKTCITVQKEARGLKISTES